MRISVLLAVSVIFVLLFTACDSIPAPSEESESLIVIARTSGEEVSDRQRDIDTKKITILLYTDSLLTFSGPVEFSLPPGSTGWSCAMKKLPPGEYSIHLDRATLPGDLQRIVIPEQSVILFPYFFVTHNNQLFVCRVGSEEQKDAIQSLSRYVGLEEWFGHEWTGFGSYQPELILTGKKYMVTIESDPGEADIYIDNIHKGKTSLILELAEGKYFIKLVKPDFESFRKMVTVNKETVIKADLIQITETASPPDNRERFSMMVIPFANLGDKADDLYSDVLKKAFELNFSLSSSLDVIEPDPGLLSASFIEDMDFSLANQYGAELILTGRYYVKDKRLFTHVCLYDVKSERIKLAEIYESSAGLTIFNAIDEMSATFLDAVTLVLPDAGEAIVEEERIPGEKILEYEKELFRKKIISKRLEKKNIITVTGGLGGTWDTITIGGQERSRLFDRGLPLSLRLKYEYLFSTDFSLGLSFVPVFGGLRLDENNVKNVVDLGFFLGPNFLLNTVMADIYVSPLLGFTFSPAIDAHIDGISETIGPFFLLGINIESGLRFYPTMKITDLPLFLTTGFSMDIIQYRFGGGYEPEPVNIQFLIHAGMGIGL